MAMEEARTRRLKELRTGRGRRKGHTVGQELAHTPTTCKVSNQHISTRRK